MKKLCLFSALLFVLLFVTGCGNNTTKVVCSQKVSIVDVDMLMDFENDSLSAMGLKYTMDLGSYTDEQVKQVEAQNLCSTVQTAMAAYSNAFTNCKQSTVDKKLVITADFILEKLPGYQSGKSESMEQAIKELEQQGYKCTK